MKDKVERVCCYCNKRVTMLVREDEATIRIYCPICKREDEIVLKGRN